MSRWIAIVLTAVLASTVSLPASAQWKWRDHSGQTQYSDLPPPPGVPEQDILSRPANASKRSAATAAAQASAAMAASAAASGTLAPRGADPELEARRKKAEQEVADKKKADEAKVAAAKAENCTRARANMRTIDSGVRMTRTNQKGELEYLDDSARAAEARKVRDVMASDCQ